MELCGNGLDNGSKMHFFVASNLAKNMLYYPVSAGEFYCNSEYCVERDSNNSVLALYVQSGCIDFYAKGVHLTACQGDLLFVDCYKPHKYLSKTNAHTLWFHFDGANTLKWFEEIKTQLGQKIKCKSQVLDLIKGIVADVENNTNQFEISSKIHSMLCQVLTPVVASDNSKINRVELAKKYINDNIKEDLTVENIANHVYLSPSYFSQIFKEVTHSTPYAYLLSTRLEQSKQLLLNTELSVSEIAYLTGFNSDANFIYFFKNQTGTTPLKFRKNGI